TTACATSPFFTGACGMASFTVTMITSPRPAYRRPEPPSTRMHSADFAPVLSAILRTDSCWIIFYLADLRRRARWTCSGGSLHEAHDAPPLQLRERARLGDADR